MLNLFYLTATLLVFFLHFSGVPMPVYPKGSASIQAGPEHSTAENDEHIPWSAYRRLHWDDFMCEPKRNTDAVASTSTSLGIAYQLKNGQLTYQITCSFSKKKSWGLVKTPYILAHEQGHFDITEIYARKLNEALQSYSYNRTDYQKEISRIYQAIVDEKEAFQRAYDGETDHSRNKKGQYEWLQKIEDLLKETAPFANYP